MRDSVLPVQADEMGQQQPDEEEEHVKEQVKKGAEVEGKRRNVYVNWVSPTVSGRGGEGRGHAAN
jgi:hypothetical protein